MNNYVRKEAGDEYSKFKLYPTEIEALLTESDKLQNEQSCRNHREHTYYSQYEENK